MLVLSRNHGERILIGDGIVITVVGFNRGCVRLGIEAPQEVAIYRSELADAIRSGGDASAPPPRVSCPCGGHPRAGSPCARCGRGS